MKDRNHQDTTSGSGTPGLRRPPKPTNRFSTVVAGILIAAMAVGAGYQFVRAKAPRTINADRQRKEMGRTDNLGQPAVRINGEEITREVLARECLEQFGGQVLESVINRTIIQQACAEHGVKITDAEVNAEVNSISKKVGIATDEWYRMVHAERGLTPLQYHRDVIWPLLALRKLAGKEVKVTADMMNKAYMDNYGPRVRAKMIIVNNLEVGQKVAEALLQDPEQFEDLARRHSTEPNSKLLGGSIPPIRKYSGAPQAIRDYAFRKFKRENGPGQISPLLQLEVGSYAILKYEGHTEPIEHDKNEVKALLLEELTEQEQQKLVGKTFEELKKKARVDNYLTGKTTSPIRRTAATSADKLPFSFDEPSLN